MSSEARALQRSHWLRVGLAALALVGSVLVGVPLWCVGAHTGDSASYAALVAALAGLVAAQLLSLATTYRVLTTRREVFSGAVSLARLARPDALLLVSVHALCGLAGWACLRALHAPQRHDAVVVGRLLNEQALCVGLGAVLAGVLHALALLWREDCVLTFESRAPLRSRLPGLLLRALRRALAVTAAVYVLRVLGAVGLARSAGALWYRVDGMELGLYQPPAGGGLGLALAAKLTLTAWMLIFYWQLGHALLEARITARLDLGELSQHVRGLDHWALLAWGLRQAGDGSLEALLQAGRQQQQKEQQQQLKEQQQHKIKKEGITWQLRLRRQQQQFQEVMQIAADRRRADKVFRRARVPLWLQCGHVLSLQYLSEVGQFDDEARQELFFDSTLTRADADARWTAAVDACCVLLDSLTMRLQVAEAASRVVMGSGGVGPDVVTDASTGHKAVEWHAERSLRKQPSAAGPWYSLLVEQILPMHPSEGAEMSKTLRQEEENVGRGRRAVQSLARLVLSRTPRQRTQALFEDAHLVATAADALSLLLAAGFHEDAVGVAQHFVPLALNSLLSGLQAVEAFVRCPGFLAGGAELLGGHQTLRPQPFAVATALERSIYRLTTTYFEHLGAFALPAQQAAKLQYFLDFRQ